MGVNDLPFVSVVMPIRNEADFIKRGLKAVFAQTYPLELLEIIIADGQSNDGTKGIIEKLRNETNTSITIVNNPERIAPTGLNRAIARSKGEIIVRVDGHCEIEPDYVANCVKYLRAGKAESVGGPIETIGETFIAEGIAIAMSSNFGVGGSAFRTINDREMYVDTVAFPGYQKKILERVGKFNEELVRNQDDEFNYRLRKLGGRILLTPDIRSRYYSRGTILSLWRQYFQYGFYKVRVLQLHPLQMRPRQFIPLIFVVSLLISLIVAFVHIIGIYFFAAIIAAYLLVNILASIKVSYKKGVKFLLLLPLCFFILHFSYGLGFLCGLFYFANRWGEKREYEVSSSNIS